VQLVAGPKWTGERGTPGRKGPGFGYIGITSIGVELFLFDVSVGGASARNDIQGRQKPRVGGDILISEGFSFILRDFEVHYLFPGYGGERKWDLRGHERTMGQ